MGITGLLPLLKSIHKHCNLKKFAGQTIGVDAYGWLHRGTVACAIDLALDKPTTKYVDFAMHRVRMLIYFGVTPYLVFDGDNLPQKGGTDADRAKRRQESKRRGLELYKAGKTSQAHQELQKAVDVTPFMARQLIEELKRLNIQYVVAPYEADAQLAYLEAKGIIDGILSEDSDLLVFGAKRLLTKLDQHGDCIEINRADFALCREISLVGWSDADFRRMAILSGCDYLPSINKMGLKTAYRYVRKYKNAEKLLRMLQLEGQFIVPVGYLEKCQQAELTFLHHRVFCPIMKKLVFLTDLQPGTKEEDLPYIGKDVDPKTAIAVACGDLDPVTKAPIILRPVATSSRAALGAPRRQNLASIADLKANRSLDSFLTTKRQPLAELDPNSLTPSPSQQRLLAANANASWEARTASSAPQLGQSSLSLSQPGEQARRTSRTTDRATFLARASAISTYQPPKRQRLCSDAEEPLGNGGVSRSRFFDSTIEEPSPSLRKEGARKSTKKSEFGIFSDDSLEDVLLELQNGSEHITYPKLDELEHDLTVDVVEVSNTGFDHDSGFFDDTQAVLESSPMGSPEAKSRPSLNQETSISNTNVLVQSSKSQHASTTGISAEQDPEAFLDLLEYHVRKQNQVLRKTFVGQSPSRRASALSTLKRESANSSSRCQSEPLATTVSDPSSVRHNPVTTGVHESQAALDVATHKNLGKTFIYQPVSQQVTALASLNRRQGPAENRKGGFSAVGLDRPQGTPVRTTTPLQRLGRQALRKTIPHPRGEAPCLQPQNLVVEGGEPLNSVANPTVLRTSSSSTVKGSEDLAGSISEEGTESDGAEETVGPAQAYLDLTKFVFTSK